MKKTIAAVFFIVMCAALLTAATDVTWYYQIESPPRSLPGVDSSHDGVMVLVRAPADKITVCVDYKTRSDEASRHICQSAPADGVGPYQAIRLDFGTPAENFQVNAISVTVGSTEKSVAAPVPGVEY